MGGEIGVRSAPGRGATFWFTVALPRALEEPAPEPARLEAPLRPLRILLAEDNQMNQQVAVGLLRRQGHDIDVVGDGHAAVEAVAARATMSSSWTCTCRAWTDSRPRARSGASPATRAGSRSSRSRRA